VRVAESWQEVAGHEPLGLVDELAFRMVVWVQAVLSDRSVRSRVCLACEWFGARQNVVPSPRQLNDKQHPRVGNCRVDCAPK